MTNQHNQTLRTFIHSLLAGSAIALAFYLGGHAGWGAGFLIGAALSLFSLYSLKVCIPALFRPGAPRYASALMQVLLLFKVPIYGVGLYLATRFGTEASFAAFGGCSLVPCVVTLETIGKVMLESNPNWKRNAAMRAQTAVLPSIEVQAHKAIRGMSEGREPLIVSSKARAVREGAA